MRATQLVGGLLKMRKYFDIMSISPRERNC